MAGPLKQVTFVHYLAPGVISRVRFARQRGRVIQFSIQLECWIANEWHRVVRYDTAHGFAHLDILRPDGSQEKLELPFESFNEALTFAQLDLKANWPTYRERYERWLAK
ncbi:MAG: hypothetical protein M1132_05910 [Chloroflexi bacterium]|nr:hypothetical protein [Chloroflexota bacterium]